MRVKLGLQIKQVAIRLAGIVGRSILGKWLLHLIEAAVKEREDSQKQLLQAQLQSCGIDIQLNGRITISCPKCVSIGNNVYLGNGVFLQSEGGITIGDQTYINSNVTICTIDQRYQDESLTDDSHEICEPVLIGKNVWIGMNVSILPGVSIGDGAIIGMGTVVSRDVPSGAMVASAPAQVLDGWRCKGNPKLDTARRNGEPRGVPSSDQGIGDQLWSAAELGNEVFYVLTTGRSGSTTLANLLSMHPQVTCLHEPRPQLIRLSTQFAHGEKDADQVRKELFAIYCNSSVYPDHPYGESDQKLWNLVPFLNDLFPEARFIWLIRNGKDVVASTHARGWFSEAEQKCGGPTGGSIYAYYRLNGGRCDPTLTADDWSAMSTFERNCWYWSFVNRQIESSLAKIDRDRWTMIRLETLESTINDLWVFLGVPPIAVAIPQSNQARVPLSHWPEWGDLERSAFMKWCSADEARWYPEQTVVDKRAR